MRYAASRDETLQDYPIPLQSLPGQFLHADLRETVTMTLLRHGCLPGQVGFDRLCGRLVRRGDTVFDVGANIGYTMILYASLVGTEGKVVAIEPGRRIFAGLSRNSGHRANVRLVHVAASDRAGEATFYETEMSDIASLEHVTGAVEFSVPTTTLDLVAKAEGPPVFVKIDVEGHEPHVLEGMTKLFRSDRPPIIIFEALNPTVRDRCAKVIRDSAGADASLYRIQGDGSLATDLDAPGTHNYLFLPSWAKVRLGSADLRPIDQSGA